MIAVPVSDHHVWSWPDKHAWWRERVPRKDQDIDWEIIPRATIRYHHYNDKVFMSNEHTRARAATNLCRQAQEPSFHETF